jgi:hypothetical protein
MNFSPFSDLRDTNESLSAAVTQSLNLTKQLQDCDSRAVAADLRARAALEGSQAIVQMVNGLKDSSVSVERGYNISLAAALRDAAACNVALQATQNRGILTVFLTYIGPCTLGPIAMFVFMTCSSSSMVPGRMWLFVSKVLLLAAYTSWVLPHVLESSFFNPETSPSHASRTVFWAETLHELLYIHFPSPLLACVPRSPAHFFIIGSCAFAVALAVQGLPVTFHSLRMLVTHTLFRLRCCQRTVTGSRHGHGKLPPQAALLFIFWFYSGAGHHLGHGISLHVCTRVGGWRDDGHEQRPRDDRIVCGQFLFTLQRYFTLMIRYGAAFAVCTLLHMFGMAGANARVAGAEKQGDKDIKTKGYLLQSIKGRREGSGGGRDYVSSSDADGGMELEGSSDDDDVSTQTKKGGEHRKRSSAPSSNLPSSLMSALSMPPPTPLSITSEEFIRDFLSKYPPAPKSYEVIAACDCNNNSCS